MAEERELILKLGQKITDRIGVKVTTKDPEYWGLAGVITDEMAEVALSMKVRVPATAPQIAKKCGKSLERTEELLQENAKKINLICERAGFSDPKYFSQVFKRTFGCSPGEFRKQGKEKRLCSIKEILEMSDDTE